MQKQFLPCVIFGLILVVWGCAGSSGGIQKRDYTVEVGVATDYDTQDKTRRLLVSRLQFEIVREEHSSESHYFETRWQPRRVLDDEIDLGITAARIRLIIKARPRVRYGGGMTQTNRVFMTAENEVLYQGSGDWVRAPMTAMLQKYLKEIADTFRIEFKAGGFRNF